MLVDIKEELKALEKEEDKIRKRRDALNAKLEAEREADKQLEKLYQQSGYATPRAFIKALMVKFGIQSATASVATPSSSGSSGRRKRTTVTASLRDSIKKDLKAGETKSEIGRKYDVSYLVVKKVENGEYDKLS